MRPVNKNWTLGMHLRFSNQGMLHSCLWMKHKKMNNSREEKQRGIFQLKASCIFNDTLFVKTEKLCQEILTNLCLGNKL